MDGFHLNASIGILGTQTISHKKTGDSKKLEITTTGSMNNYHIPAVIVFCEDKLAQEVITMSMPITAPISYNSFKFIINGSWRNIIISMAGSLLYSDELKKTGTTKFLSTVGIIDGDITDAEISDAISSCYKGSYVPEQLEKIKKSIKKNLVSFQLPENIIGKKNTTGKPELNIKNMLEEINEESIDAVLGGEIKKLNSYLDKAVKDTEKQIIESEIYFLEEEIKDVLKIIEISKSLKSKKFKVKRNGRYNYHFYLNRLEEHLKGQYFGSYGPSLPPTLLLIYILINKFNEKRWYEYVNPVIDFLTQIAEEQRERYSHNTYNNQVID
ncbi:hypothetical protein M8G38_12750 [Providencia stuartii]|uniref:hypothetical protein n=1 Tax=Providencia stuartii TaxID=588 RepID=UPI00201D81F6|nr:hypothetical protein [Providencia stuartii]UQZ10668.1 hypothetical protein M8G38_12750 [Providencia stuartii]